MPGFLPPPDITPRHTRASRSYCPECNKLSVITYETGARVCVSCGTFVAPDPPAKPSVEQVFALFRDGRWPSARTVRDALDVNLVRFAQLVHGYLDAGSADRVNPELAESLRRRREQLRKLRTVA